MSKAKRQQPTGPRERLLSLLQGCKDDDRDDAVRLVLSDWLEEHGDEDDLARAELIRLQIATNTDRARVRQLIQTHRAKWLGPLARAEFECEWSRGLLRVECYNGEPTRIALKHATKLEVFDWVEHLAVLGATRKDVRALAALPRLRELGSLELSIDRGDSGAELVVNFEAFCRLSRVELANLPMFGIEGEEDEHDPSATTLDLTDASLEMVANCAHLDRLMSLELLRGRIGIVGLSALGSSTCLPRLAELRFYDCGLDADSLEALIAAPALAGLTWLGLNHEHFGPEGMDVLVRAKQFGRLEELSLEYSTIGSQGLIALANSSAFPKLHRLGLLDCELDDTGIVALAESDLLRSVTDLHLGTNLAITVDGLRTLVESPRIANLERLVFTDNNLGDPSAEVLASSPHLGRLRRLELENNSMTVEGVEALTRSPFLNRIEWLELQMNEIGDRGARALANWPALAECVELSLWGSDPSLTDEGVRALAESPYLSKLRRLNLLVLDIGDEGALALMNSTKLPSLEELLLSPENLSPELVPELESRFGGSLTG